MRADESESVYGVDVSKLNIHLIQTRIFFRSLKVSIKTCERWLKLRKICVIKSGRLSSNVDNEALFTLSSSLRDIFFSLRDGGWGMGALHYLIFFISFSVSKFSFLVEKIDLLSYIIKREGDLQT